MSTHMTPPLAVPLLMLEPLTGQRAITPMLILRPLALANTLTSPDSLCMRLHDDKVILKYHTFYLTPFKKLFLKTPKDV